MTRNERDRDDAATNRRTVLRGFGVAATGSLVAAAATGSAAASSVQGPGAAASLAETRSDVLLDALDLSDVELRATRAESQVVPDGDSLSRAFRIPLADRDGHFVWSTGDHDLLPAVVEFDRGGAGPVLSYRTMDGGRPVALDEGDLALDDHPQWDVCPDFDGDCAASIALATAAGAVAGGVTGAVSGTLAGLSAASQCEMC